MYQELHIQDEHELLEVLTSFTNDFVYRGHGDQDWGLSSTLERLLGQNWNVKNIRNCNETSEFQFKANFFSYNFSEQVPQTKLEWLSMRQHYGLPTHALDVTSSPFIALYFALESFSFQTEKNMSIFAFNYKTIVEYALERLHERDNDVPLKNNSLIGRQDAIFEKYILTREIDIIWITEPQIFNKRIDRQAGSFLISGNQYKKIEDVIELCGYPEGTIQKLIIPGQISTGLYDILRKCGISAKSIYGDLSGLAKAITMDLKIHL